MVNTDLLIKSLGQFKPGISGHVFHNPAPIRDTKLKWFMPYRYWPTNVYPDYMSGPAMVWTKNISQLLMKALDDYNGYYLQFEDMFTTGVIGSLANITRHNTRLIDMSGCSAKRLCSQAITYDCNTGADIQQSWSGWLNRSDNYCDSQKYSQINVILIDIILTLILFNVVISFSIYYNLKIDKNDI